MVFPSHTVASPETGHGERTFAVRLLAVFTSIFLILMLTDKGHEAKAFEKWIAKKQFDITGAGGTTFNQPSDIIIFEKTIYVLDSMNNRVCRFDFSGRHLGSTTGTADAPLVGAMGIAQDHRGRFFIADGYRGRVLTFTAGDKPSVLINLITDTMQNSPDPTGLLFFGNRLYIADNDNHSISMYSSEGILEGQWGGSGEGAGLFRYPFRIAADPLGRIGVTDVLNSRVQFFTPKGVYLSEFGKPGTVSGTLFRPGGFDIDSDGSVFIADNYFGCIQVFDGSGKLLALLHDADLKPLSLKNPVSIEVHRNNILVVEMGANRVSVFSLEK